VPRRCSICYHGDRETIDELLLAKTSQVLIAEQFKVSPDAIFNHNKQHLHLPMAKAAEKALVGRCAPAKLRLERAQNAIEIAHGTDLLAQMSKLVGDATRIKERAEEKLDLRTALQGVRELTRLVELAGRLTGQLAGGSAFHVGVQVNANGRPVIPLEVWDSVLEEERERTGENDVIARFSTETSGFMASDFAELWNWCREHRTRGTATLLQDHAAVDLPADGPEDHSSEYRGQKGELS